MTIIPNFVYLNNPNCLVGDNIVNSIGPYWSGVLLCNSSSKVRRLHIQYSTIYNWYANFYIGQLKNSTSSNASLIWKYYPFHQYNQL